MKRPGTLTQSSIQQPLKSPTAPAPDVVSDLQASPTKKQKLSASTGAITKKNTKLRRMTVVKVHAPTGFLGFILKAKKHNRAGDYRSQKSIRLVL